MWAARPLPELAHHGWNFLFRIEKEAALATSSSHDLRGALGRATGSATHDIGLRTRPRLRHGPGAQLMLVMRYPLGAAGTHCMRNSIFAGGWPRNARMFCAALRACARAALYSGSRFDEAGPAAMAGRLHRLRLIGASQKAPGLGGPLRKRACCAARFQRTPTPPTLLLTEQVHEPPPVSLVYVEDICIKALSNTTTMPPSTERIYALDTYR